MERLKRAIRYFTPFEIALWVCSVVFICVAFGVFDRENVLTLAASLVGATSLIFTAKGNALGQVLIVVFSVLYGVISYSYAYYGEMITYLGMSAPIAILAIIAWLRHPYAGRHSEVKVNKLKGREYIFLAALAAAVTTAFWFILDALDTANMIPSTVSVTTSFVAAYLTFRRSPFYALAYAANDIVLIVLWVLASVDDIKYISMVICFATFLVNDVYGFVNWSKMRKRQRENACETAAHSTEGEMQGCADDAQTAA